MSDSQKNIMVFVQPVFAPSRGQLDLNLNSLISLAEYIKDQENPNAGQFDILLGGWTMDPKYWDEIIQVCDNFFPPAWNISLKKFNENVGKATIVNFLLKEYLPQHPNIQYIFTCDSDMVFMKEHKLMFQRAMVASQVAEKVRKQRVGFIAFNQEEDNCHWLNHMDIKVPYKIEDLGLTETIGWPSSKCGLAGGALFIKRDAWDAVGGYSVGNHPYYGEDGFLLRDIQAAGFSTSLLLTCAVKHPKQEDQEYIEWKKNAMKDTHQSFETEKQKVNVAASEDFWRKKNDSKNLQ